MQIKIRNLFFLSRANLKGAKRKKSVLVMMTLSVISVVLLAGFITIFINIINTYNANIECRQISVSPEMVFSETKTKGINEKTKGEVLDIEHVVSCEMQPYEEYEFPFVKKITDENGTDVTDSLGDLTPEKITSGIDHQMADSVFSVPSIKGEQLKDAPVMSCIAPDFGYPYGDKRFDSSALLGKTLTLKVPYQFVGLYNKGESGGYEQNRDIRVDITYDLKVVGIYHYTNESTYGGVAFLISPETAKKIEDMALSEAQKNNYDVEDYINDPYSRNQIVTVDDEKNVSAVLDKLSNLGYTASVIRSFEPSREVFISFFTGAGTFLLGAILLLMVICLFLSVYTNINSRRSEIGLMKALGYKSSHIFVGMYIENVILSIRALIAGVAVSAVVSLIVNAINSSSERLLDHSYVMSFQVFGIMTLIAFAVILAVPLLCQLIMVKRLSNIRPQEAMNS